MESLPSGDSSHLLKSIFGTLSEGLSIFSNNPFRRKEERPQHSGDDGGLQKDVSTKVLRDMEVASDGGGAVSVGEMRNGLGDGSDAKASKLLKRYPAMELAKSRKRAKKAIPAEVVEGGALEKRREKLENEDGEPKKKSTKKKKKEIVVGEPLSGGKETALGEQSNVEQASQYQPGTPDGSDEILAESKFDKVKRGKTGPEQTAARKRQKTRKVDGPEEHKIVGHTGSVLDGQSEGTRHVTGSKRTKPDSAQAARKRKREDEIEARYEKKFRVSDPTEDFKEKRRVEHTEWKTEAQNLVNRKRKNSEDKDERTREDKGEAPSKRRLDDEGKLKRTVFVGNLPIKVKKKAIFKEFSQYGPVESLRLRSVPLLDTKIPRKGAIIKGKVNESVESQHAYIVFEEETSANAALAHNMKEFDGNHVRVDVAHAPSGALKGKSPLSYDRARSVFVGNVPFDVKDEELYQIFATGRSPDLDIEAIRVVRDPQTSLCKGIAFVLFKTKAGVSRILLSRRGLKLRDRILRVSRVLATETEQKQFKRPAKRLRDAETEEDGWQKKRAKLSTSYEGTRASKADNQKRRWTSSRVVSKENGISSSKGNTGHASAKGKRLSTVAGRGGNEDSRKFSGSKRKRAEKHQRGISRSKKIRRR